LSSSSETLELRSRADIGSNLVDPVFRGTYHGKKQHPDDLTAVLSRARAAGVVKQILTGDSLSGAKAAIELAEQEEGLYATVGCHPCRADKFDQCKEGPTAYLEELAKVIEQDRKGKRKVVAVGECGLDYDRLSLCSKEVQLKCVFPSALAKLPLTGERDRYFPIQLELATRFDLPLFLHSRAAHSDLVQALKAHPHPLRGVVHSHSGTLEEALEYIDLGFFVGIKFVFFCLMIFLRYSRRPTADARSKWKRTSLASKHCR
jgi:TatD DNase family protein